MTEPKPRGRQRVEKTGRRRARLTAVPGTIPDADGIVALDEEPAGASDAIAGPNDARMRREKPPHY